MRLVTLADRMKALGLVGVGSAAQDRLLQSLAQETTWTHNQRALIERLWIDRQAGPSRDSRPSRPSR